VKVELIVTNLNDRLVAYVTGNVPVECLYEACLERNDTKFLNMYNLFNLQKRHFE